MTFYFIDFENLSDNVFSLIKIPPSDTVQTFLFYRPNTAHTIDLRKVKHLKIDAIECKGSKKELVDNILCARLGYFIAKNECVQNEHLSYIVVSSDKGFSQICDYWKKQGYDVSFIYITEEEKTKKKSGTVRIPKKNSTEKAEPQKTKKTEKNTSKKAKQVTTEKKVSIVANNTRIVEIAQKNGLSKSA